MEGTNCAMGWNSMKIFHPVELLSVRALLDQNGAVFDLDKFRPEARMNMTEQLLWWISNLKTCEHCDSLLCVDPSSFPHLISTETRDWK